MNPVILNNKAAHLMNGGAYEHAACLLSDGLKSLSQSLRFMMADTNGCKSANMNGVDDSVTGEFVQFMSKPVCPQKMGMHAAIRDQEEEERRLGCCYYYSQAPLTIDHQQFRHSQSTTELELEKTAFVILYNLALSWHSIGLQNSQDGEEREMNLRRALSIYRHANSVLRHGRVPQNCFQNVALVCNVGHIFLLLGEQERYDKCSETLLSSVLCLIHEGVSPEENEQLGGALSNVLPMMFNCDASPASAA